MTRTWVVHLYFANRSLSFRIDADRRSANRRTLECKYPAGDIVGARHNGRAIARI